METVEIIKPVFVHCCFLHLLHELRIFTHLFVGLWNFKEVLGILKDVKVIQNILITDSMLRFIFNEFEAVIRALLMIHFEKRLKLNFSLDLFFFN